MPEPLRAEHEEIHNDFRKILKMGGKVGEAARRVESVLHPHFLKEEELAMPILGLLRELAEGRDLAAYRGAVDLGQRFAGEYGKMLEEHKAIVAALEEMKAVAKGPKKKIVHAFADKLILHAKTEEEVLYPAALLAVAEMRKRA